MKETYINEVRAFNRVYTVFMGILGSSFLKSKFTLVETRVMHCAYVEPGIVPLKIVTLLNIDKSYLSRILSSLERRNVIVKKQSGTDRRSVRIFITKLGKREFEKLNAAANKQVETLFAKLNGSDCKRIVTNMSEIRNLLEKRLLLHEDQG